MKAEKIELLSRALAIAESNAIDELDLESDLEDLGR